jgi:hypothetical protein
VGLSEELKDAPFAKQRIHEQLLASACNAMRRLIEVSHRGVRPDGGLAKVIIHYATDTDASSPI